MRPYRPPFHVKQLHERYIELVLAGPSGLFSRGDLDRLRDHVSDGITGAATLAELGARSIADVGSGGGVPAIPVAIELPDASLHLIESQRWKAEFLHACAHELSLESRMTVHPIRAEAAPARIGRELLDAGIARAVADPLVVAEYLAPLVRVGGHLVLWTTRVRANGEGVAAHELLGLGAPEIRPAPSALREDGVLLVWPRIAPCTDRVPRRAGVASRRPLR
jgi:16S rRNA (guanine527-N7)-methyltransferase